MKDDSRTLASAERLFRWGAWLLVPVYGLMALSFVVESEALVTLNGFGALLMIVSFMASSYKFATVSKEPRVVRVAYSIAMLVQPFAIAFLWFLRSNARDAAAGPEVA